jgi:hypothetical protein
MFTSINVPSYCLLLSSPTTLAFPSLNPTLSSSLLVPFSSLASHFSIEVLLGWCHRSCLIEPSVPLLLSELLGQLHLPQCLQTSLLCLAQTSRAPPGCGRFPFSPVQLFAHLLCSRVSHRVSFTPRTSGTVTRRASWPDRIRIRLYFHSLVPALGLAIYHTWFHVVRQSPFWGVPLSTHCFFNWPPLPTAVSLQVQ